MSRKKEPEKFKMILYTCPYCGKKLLKAEELVVADDIWCCEHCGTRMEVA